jgi:hypothetical protein
MESHPPDDTTRTDPFAPPSEPILVTCLHCAREYMSSEMRWADGFWWCGTQGCSGKGYGFDVFAIDGSCGFTGGWFDDDGNRVPPPWLHPEEDP